MNTLLEKEINKQRDNKQRNNKKEESNKTKEINLSKENYITKESNLLKERNRIKVNNFKEKEYINILSSDMKQNMFIEDNNNYQVSIKLSYNEFLESIKNRLSELVEIGCKVYLNHVTKNNGQELDGIIINRENDNIAPNIYINNFYNDYIKGESINSIAERIMDIYSDRLAFDVDIDDINFDFENIKDKITYRLVSYAKNERLLLEIPYIRFLDLAVVFCCVVRSDNNGIASIRLSNEHLKMWQISADDLLKYATINTPRIMPGVIKNMSDVIKDIALTDPFKIFGEDKTDRMAEDGKYLFDDDKVDREVISQMIDKVTMNNGCEMYVVTNENGLNGATVILYNGLLKEFADRLNMDLFILPSSIHEVIIIPYLPSMDIDELKEMVTDINEQQVPLADILSSNVYVYSREEDALILM